MLQKTLSFMCMHVFWHPMSDWFNWLNSAINGVMFPLYVSCCLCGQPEMIGNNVNSDDLDKYSVGLFPRYIIQVRCTQQSTSTVIWKSKYTSDRVTVWRLYILEKTACDVKVWHPKLKWFNDENARYLLRIRLTTGAGGHMLTNIIFNLVQPISNESLLNFMTISVFKIIFWRVVTELSTDENQGWIQVKLRLLIIRISQIPISSKLIQLINICNTNIIVNQKYILT